ncbi:SGNH/GDSL hydrolase family protein [Nocardioides soli]|uniref:Uncharacterized protein n=1 Tax=Nocardioides soli TaxID=1036020 RepID=A0A7W4VY90_9ACTN|nr:hypothetical protein [Nocardioides soli]MBB3043930.1 hypothetical protein [Nocardioides soli]
MGTSGTRLAVEAVEGLDLVVAEGGKVPEAYIPDRLADGQVVVGDGSGNVPEDRLPERLSAGSLTASTAQSIQPGETDPQAAVDARTATALDLSLAPGARAFVSRVRMGLSAAFGIASDSTADKMYEWLVMGLLLWTGRYAPRANVDVYERNGSAASYKSPVPVQTGVSARATVIYDDFATPASDVIGTTPTVGTPWAGSHANAANDFDVANGRMRATSSETLRATIVNTVPVGDRAMSGRTYQTGVGVLRLGIARKDDNNWLALFIDRAAGNWRGQIVQRIAGAQATIATMDQLTNFPAGDAFDFGIQVVGSRCTAQVNGAPLGCVLDADATDLVATSTLIGIWVTTNFAVELDYVRVEQLTAATAPPTVSIYNGGLSGSQLSEQQGHIAELYPSSTPLHGFAINHGHNHGSTSPTAFLEAIDSFVADLRAQQPSVGLIVASQNPELLPSANVADHRARNAALPAYARRNGYTYVPGYESYSIRLDGGASAIQASDGVHPYGSLAEPAGSGLQANALADTLATF